MYLNRRWIRGPRTITGLVFARECDGILINPIRINCIHISQRKRMQNILGHINNKISVMIGNSGTGTGRIKFTQINPKTIKIFTCFGRWGNGGYRGIITWIEPPARYTVRNRVWCRRRCRTLVIQIYGINLLAISGV